MIGERGRGRAGLQLLLLEGIKSWGWGYTCNSEGGQKGKSSWQVAAFVSGGVTRIV